MELTINAAGDEQALTEFYSWLRDDADVTRSATISFAGSRNTEVFEVICMSIGSLTGLANLGIAWGNFLRSREETPPFVISVEGELTAEERAMIRNLDLPFS
ncbi:hypothetical protein ACFWIW_19560 [Amycolatopsis sp. NPDC058340]|uniref:effector-associated constant component EACC1 n=1 Tax=Amycolatopsis sp. NPDC058340 TaxID=3346453 RepID=UPI0036663F7D